MPFSVYLHVFKYSFLSTYSNVSSTADVGERNIIVSLSHFSFFFSIGTTFPTLQTYTIPPEAFLKLLLLDLYIYMSILPSAGRKYPVSSVCVGRTLSSTPSPK